MEFGSFSEVFSEILTTPFLTRALLAMLIVAPLLAVAGCIVVHSNLAFFSEAIGHSTLTGVALGTLIGFADQSITLVVTACIFAVLVTVLKYNSGLSTDSIISLSMSFCVALGVAVLSRGGAFSSHSHILVGDLLTVTGEQLIHAAWIAIFALLALIVLWNGLTLTTINNALARSRGIPVFVYDLSFSLLLAAVVTLSVPWVGILVVNSLLVLPAATARNITRSMRAYVWCAIALSILASFLGVVFSVYFDSATGATVVLVSLLFFVVSLVPRVRAA